MLIVYTLFDPNVDGRPLASGVFDTITNKLSIYFLYLPKTNKSFYEINRDKIIISDQINQSQQAVLLNDAKQHFIAFDINPNINLYDAGHHTSQQILTPDVAKKFIVTAMTGMRNMQLDGWRKIKADASLVYKEMQCRGLSKCGTIVRPIWHLDLYSGRSRSIEFNIQGYTHDDIYNPNGDEIFLHFDWIAADMRVVAIMSGDKKLEHAFTVSDPYQYIVDDINKISEKQLTRSEGKKLLLSGLYSMNHNSQAMRFYPDLAMWVADCKQSLKENGYISSILGRKFFVDGERTELSAFNATVQGSVAHAMQVCIRKIWDLYPSSILSEHHDSLVVTCKNSPDEIRERIKKIIGIMRTPFSSILLKEHVFPIKVSMGKSYRKWVEIRRYG